MNIKVATFTVSEKSSNTKDVGAYHISIRRISPMPSLLVQTKFILFYSFIVRLTPVYALVLMVFATLLKYWPTGPLWTVVHPTFEYCKDIWWSHLLYINNFIHTDRPVSRRNQNIRTWSYFFRHICGQRRSI